MWKGRHAEHVPWGVRGSQTSGYGQCKIVEGRRARGADNPFHHAGRGGGATELKSVSVGQCTAHAPHRHSILCTARMMRCSCRRRPSSRRTASRRPQYSRSSCS
ncbi:hypothetical protein TRVL_09952 [Trypanosoma vivax]|nr:hypothetical protein TRVL_09952 [Trypanosoma vivax]